MKMNLPAALATLVLTGPTVAQTLPSQAASPPSSPTEAKRPAPMPSTAAKPALVKMVTNCQVGLIRSNIAFDETAPANYCLDDRTYIGADGRLGRINIFRRPPLVGRLNMGMGMGMISATLVGNLFKRLTPSGGCAKLQPKVYQFRGDWYADEGGYDSTTVERLQKASYLEMTGEITPIDMLSYDIPKYKRSYRSKSGPKEIKPVLIKLRNPFDTKLENLGLILHFEGGSGKPMPRYKEEKFTLEPGQVIIRTVPSHEQLPTGQGHYTAWWRFATATLEGNAGGCTFRPTHYRR